MVLSNYKQRPTCAEILASNQWTFSKNEVKHFGLDNSIMNNQLPEHFYKTYLNARLTLLKHG